MLALPLLDILITQRVAKAWQDIVNGSDSLQQVLFLKPISNLRVSLVSGRNQSRQSDWVDDEGRILENGATLNPFLGRLLYENTEYAALSLSHRGLIEPEESPSCPAVLRQPASWRRMLLLQPPAKFLKMIGYDECEGVEVENDAGISIGWLVNVLRNHFRHCGECQTEYDTEEIDPAWHDEGFGNVQSLRHGCTTDGSDALAHLRTVSSLFRATYRIRS